MIKINPCKEIIENNLKNSSLNFLELINKVKLDLTNENKKFTSKKFSEALMSLLKENEIVISGYDFNVHNVKDGRIQSFKKEGVKFELVKTEQTEIFAMLKEIETSDNSLKARRRLQESFIRKFKQYESKKYEYWDTLESKIETAPLKDYIKVLEEDLEKQRIMIKDIKKNKIKGKEYLISDTHLNDELKECKTFFEEDKNSKIWLFHGLNYEDLEEALNIHPRRGLETSKSNKLSYELKDCCVMDDIIEKRLIEINGLLKSSELSSNKNIKATPENFLCICGLEKPLKRTSEEIKSMFSRILFYVNAHENSNFMKQSFSWALSDEKDSMNWFELFINTNTNLKGKLRSELPQKPHKTIQN